ncbi:PRD domain-containing protein [Thalassobacillus sp. B23F22_16]|uniref:PRD domain-containing protein n=1 Tax=Thalassobacillus sp. B23F22_16 TaxID=3459513 RepID=UPI00373EF30F
MRIERILNENIVIAADNQQNKMVLGQDIAHKKKRGDYLSSEVVEIVISMEDDISRYEGFFHLVSEEVIRLTEDIITHAEEFLQTDLNESLHMELADHLAFLLADPPKHVTIQNGLIEEIDILYAKEYQVGLRAVRLIKERFNRELPEKEAGHIAVFIHGGRSSDSNNDQSVKKAAIIRDLIDIIERVYQRYLARENVAYQHLVTHLNRAIGRREERQVVDKDMLVMIQNKYQTAYQCAVDIAAYLSDEYYIHFPSAEVGYLTLHIHRAAKA